MTTIERPQKAMTKYVVTYGCILVVATLQFIITYLYAGAPELWSRLLFLAIVEAILAVLFFMHLWMENRRLLWSVVLVMLFLLITLQYGWTDSFRVLHGVPWSAQSGAK
jgi:cytochrome c oxidase subunit IV